MKVIDSHVVIVNLILSILFSLIYPSHSSDLRSFRDSRKEMEHCREGLESALHHNAETPRRKIQEVQDVVNAVQVSRRVFRERALEYTLQINVIQGKKEV
ncbi:hypothetical protein GDO86_018993 [Hymenochirus boettgeri]|uniref:BAR domain-containing protein n=1 Tax=Hymenochirus boettgeri TaxID=247094 RepID=A0A8T2IEF7_9PIPI|nr:hypothetical protein GDO86_018993 [Hymenochirus boettgeri]